MKTDEFIVLLVADTASKSFGNAFRNNLAAGIALAVLVFLFSVGVRPDIDQAMTTVRFDFKVMLALSLAVTATGSLMSICRPGSRSTGWLLGLGAVPVMLLVAVGMELSALPQGEWIPRFVGRNVIVCLTVIPALAIMPLSFLIVALRRGAPRNPGLAGGLAGIVAGGVAATLYATSCVNDSPLFVAVWYTVSIISVAVLGYFLGGKFLRW
ncbi:NrsF family protein [Rhizobium sp. P44RR-XXIV]|uniref:NrsF family protein n=1 Tax=Rhizobium sp. P44RR-XXIV TaxID=1921145 RepID=UPI0009CB3C77|nr:NrsF family protein [Rhizobium sp. P44RR-XXIV]